MGDTLEKTVEQLPDIWFDWYARLLPGCFGVGLYLYLSLQIPASPTGVHVLLFLLSGYAAGHIAQPISGFFIKRIEKHYGNERKYAQAKRELNPKTSLLNKVSKAHAEANSMFVFGLMLLLNVIWFWTSPRLNKIVAFLVLAYFLFATWERTAARNRKIEDLDKDSK